MLFFKDDLSDMTVLVDYDLSHEDEREEISVTARDYLIKTHTHIQRT